MNIVLLGAPGAGKGTQAAKLISAYRLAHISTGDILRAAVKAGTELGLEAKRYMDAGELVPDSVVIGLVKDRLSQSDTQAGFILDGFPRTTAQAEALDAELDAMGRSIDAAVAIEVDPEVIVARLTSRRVCLECGFIGTVEDGPECPICFVELVQRDDDKEDTVRNRLAVYEKSTAPLISYYEARGVIKHIDGDRPVEDVFADVVVAVEA